MNGFQGGLEEEDNSLRKIKNNSYLKSIMEKIKFSDWEKLDIRVGKILKIETIEGADKLYKLEVNLGGEIGNRTIVAGLKPHYEIKNLEGKQVIVLTNLEPRRLKGIESQGMILAAIEEISNGKEKVKILQPQLKIKEGSKIR